MSKFISNFVFLLLFIICARFSIAESLDRTWINTCRVLNCQLSLDFCIQMNCLGKESCLDCISGELKKKFDLGVEPTSILLLSNGNLAVGSADGVIRTFDLSSDSTFNLIQTLYGNAPVTGLVELPNQDLASIGNDGTLYYWNINDESHYLVKYLGYTHNNFYCMILLNRNEIGICSESSLLVYDIKSESVKYSIGSSLYVIHKVSTIGDQRLFLYGANGFSVLDLQQKKEMKYWINDPNDRVYSALFVNSTTVDMVSNGNGLAWNSDLRLWKLY